MKIAQNNQFLGLHQVLMEQKNVINASSIVVLQYRKYVVQKGSLFIVTLGNYATKTAKKTVRKTVKMAQNSQFLGLHQVLMEQKNILNASSIVFLQYRKYVVQKGSLFIVTLGNYATKTAKNSKKKL